MASLTADRNLLFGILAVQMDFISRDALIGAMNSWVLNKTQPLGKILVDQQALLSERRTLLDALVDEHLKAHGGDAEKSLAAVGAAGPVRAALQQVADADIHATLANLTKAHPPSGDPFATRDLSVGAATSSGQRFRILRPHARGGLGEVLVAEDAELHREVALKHIQDQQADDPDSRARFLLEAEITGGLEHPGVVPVYGLGSYADGRPYYAMRFIRGSSLKQASDRFHQPPVPGQALEDRTLAVRQLLDRFLDVCNAIAYAHSRGVLHRDLKPSNVMLGQYGETLVVDWGLAKARAQVDFPSEMPPLTPHSSGKTDATLPGQMIGTPAYMAPEQAQGRQDQIDERTDIYGLGAILFDILTGRPPHEGTDVFTVLRNANANPTPHARSVVPSVPQALDAICAKAMAAAPNDRYARAGDLALDVQRFLADEPVTAWREPWRVRTRRWLGKHRTLVTASSATVLATLVLLAVTAVLLNAARARERAARTLAEHNYQLARKAVARYFTEVSENVLLHEPGMDALRNQLLQAASDFYTKFVQERGQDPTARNDLGKAVYRLGLITGEVDSNQKALALEQQAIDIFTALAAEQPGDLGHKNDLALSYYELGRLNRLTDQLPKAEQAYQNAVDRGAQLAQASPQDDGYQASLARSQRGLGNVYQVTRRMDQALAWYGKALTIYESLAARFPKQETYQRDLATTRYDMGLVYQALGQADKAQEAFQGAQVVQEQLVKNHPEVQQYQDDLAGTDSNLGDLDYRLSQLDRALPAYQRAVNLRKELARVHPAILTFQLKLATTWLGLARTQLASQRLAQAQEACQQGLTLCAKLAAAHPDLAVGQYNLGSGYYLQARIYEAQGQGAKAEGAYQQAAVVQQKLADKYSDASQYQSDLARTDNGLGRYYLKSGNGPAAEASGRKALALWQALMRAHPQELEFVLGLSDCLSILANKARTDGQTQAALDFYGQSLKALENGDPPMGQRAGAQATYQQAYFGRAQLLTKLARYKDALSDWDKVVLLSSGSAQLWYKLYRAQARADAGDYTGADAEASALANQNVDSGEARYLLAKVFAGCASGVAFDNAVAFDQRGKRAQVYETKALSFLEGAQEAGYFQNAAHLARLKSDPAFTILRARPEFNALLGNGTTKDPPKRK